jgi:hypothetical protein
VAVASSALITRLLPFNELNAEIAARTTPTALDLLVAAFCALAGVYAVMRQDSDVASTAAGTSIGISLVPPLCASGYGVGTSTWLVASGAALLFLTNFVAIVVVSTLCFAATGFHRVDIRTLEAEELGSSDDDPMTRRLAKLFASRSGPWLRLLMPLILLAAVYVPLRQALDEVVWQIRSRKEVHSVLDLLPHRLVQSRVVVERGRIELSLVLLGSSADAATTRARVEQDVRARTGVTPRLEVFAIPDATAFAGLEAALHRDGVRDGVPPAAQVPSLGSDLSRTQSSVLKAVQRRWPASNAGEIASLVFDVTGTEISLELIHLGRDLGVAAQEVLQRAFAEDMGAPVKVTLRALPKEPLRPADPTNVEFVAELADMLALARRTRAVRTCVVTAPPTNDEPAGATKNDAPGEPALALALLKAHPRTEVSSGDSFSVRFSTEKCAPDEPVTPTSAPSR